MMLHSLELFLPVRERMSGRLNRTAAPRVPTGVTLVLEKAGLISLRLSGRSLRIGCVAGTLWATVAGSGEDQVLLPGEAQTIRSRGKVVIQALQTATVRLDTAPLSD